MRIIKRDQLLSWVKKKKKIIYIEEKFIQF